MKRNTAYLLFILVGLHSLSSFSTELSQRTGIRQRIQLALEKKNCIDVVNARPTTRGITRGGPVTRSAFTSQYPSKVIEFSDRFSQVIQVEFGLPYGFEHDPHSFFFLQNDPHESAAKLRIYKMSGYEWLSPGSPSRSPTWLELAKNHRANISRLGLDPAKQFRPVIVLYKSIGNDKFEYLFIDPLTESFPRDMSTWSVLTKDVQFNIPFAAIFNAMKEGKFPLLDANHDFGHFVANLRFPELTAAIIEMIQKSTPETVTLGFKRRQYWLTEALSVLDPANFHLNQNFLRSQKRSLQPRDLKMVESELLKMSEPELLKYALDLARYFESQLRDISGGNSNAAEKWYYLSESFGMKAQDLLAEDITQAERLDRIAELARAYFENGPITLNANPKKMTNETATFNFNTFVASQKLLALVLVQNPKTQVSEIGISRKNALAFLVKFISRTELMLQTSPPTYAEWAQGFLQGELPMTNPLAQTLLQVFGNDIVRDIYLGAGIKRGE